MKDKQTLKESIKKEAERKLEQLAILQTSLVPDLSSNVKEDLMSLFQYVGSYLSYTYQRSIRKLRYINLKIKKNATKP